MLKELLTRISESKQQIKYSCTLIPEKNWNAQWESEFQPIDIDSAVKTRASFHEKDLSIILESAGRSGFINEVIFEKNSWHSAVMLK